MSRTAAELSVAELEKILQSRKSRIETLRKKRERLRNELLGVENEIRELEGRNPGGSSAVMRERFRNRPKNEKSLRTHVLDILGQHPGGLTLADLAAAILEQGYKTNSTNFKNVLYQCLYNSDRVKHDPTDGVYRILEPN